MNLAESTPLEKLDTFRSSSENFIDSRRNQFLSDLAGPDDKNNKSENSP